MSCNPSLTCSGQGIGQEDVMFAAQECIKSMLSNGQHFVSIKSVDYTLWQNINHEDKYKKHVMWLRSNEGQFCVSHDSCVNAAIQRTKWFNRVWSTSEE